MALVIFTSKFLRDIKYCGVSGKKKNVTKNIIGSGENIFGTKKYDKYVPATKPNRIPMVTLSMSREPNRPRILWIEIEKWKTSHLIFFSQE